MKGVLKNNMIMLEHINNILIDIDKLLEEDKYKLNNINIVKENLQSFKKF